MGPSPPRARHPSYTAAIPKEPWSVVGEAQPSPRGSLHSGCFAVKLPGQVNPAQGSGDRCDTNHGARSPATLTTTGFQLALTLGERCGGELTKNRISRLRRKTRLGRRTTSAEASDNDSDSGLSTAIEKEDRSDTPTEVTATVAEAEDLAAEDTSTVTEADGGSDATDPSSSTFTDQDWEDQFYALMAEQADPLPCPDCGRAGFYGPRALDGKPKFRACRFCGFFQEVMQQPTRLQPVAHDCDNWPEAAGAPYIWWIPKSEKWYTCNYCARRVAITQANAFMKGAAVTSPADDPNHPWQKVPQNASYDTYYKLWENWPATKGRVFL